MNCGGRKFPQDIRRMMLFVRMYSKAVERSNMKSNKSSHIEETPYKERPVPFYNWLEERDSLPQLMVYGQPSLDNWLEW